MKSMSRKLLGLGLCVALTLGLGACGSESADSVSSESTAFSTAESTAESGSAAEKENASSTETAFSAEESAGNLDTSETVKIGVLVADATSAEALGFRSYYENYIQDQYNVEFVYSDELADSAAEKSAIDTMITNNCQAIISFSSFDRAAQIDQCESAGIYYAVATGTLSDEEYETYKGYEHYVGAVGPTLDIEYETGYEMAKYYLDQGMTKFAIFGGAVAYRTDMHIYRVAGMLTAMVEAGGDGASYDGVSTKEEIVGKLYESGDVVTGSIGSIELAGYLGGYDMDDAFFAKAGEITGIDGLEALLCVGNGSDFFGTMLTDSDVQLASVDAFVDSYGEAMEAGTLNYLAGKFSASIGPIFIATYRTALGSPVRDADGNALALAQGYWIATSYEEFESCLAADSDEENPAYSKEDLDPLLTADYDTFASFVSAYDFDSVAK